MHYANISNTNMQHCCHITYFSVCMHKKKEKSLILAVKKRSPEKLWYCRYYFQITCHSLQEISLEVHIHAFENMLLYKAAYFAFKLHI